MGLATDLGCHVTKTAFHISLAILSSITGLLLFVFFHNSLIIHSFIHQIVFGYFDLYFLLFINIKYDMKTEQKIINNSIKENRLPLKVSSLRKRRQYLGITHLCENAHFTYKILQYTCFNCTCYTCSYDKCV